MDRLMEAQETVTGATINLPLDEQMSVAIDVVEAAIEDLKRQRQIEGAPVQSLAAAGNELYGALGHLQRARALVEGS